MIIPETLEVATSAAWLSEALGAEVTAVTVGEIDQRVSTNAPISVDLADGQTRHYYVKGYFGEDGRFARSAGIPEAMFYRELADSTGMVVRTVPAAAKADADLPELVAVLRTATG